ncbi:MAG TPA: tetratricopeptide repeat protein [Thermoanaerobaculia bacterium]
MTRPSLAPRPRLAAVLAVLPLVLLAQAQEPPAPPDESERIAHDLAAFGFHVTSGATPGYIDERACELCHTALAKGYQRKGMARAFRRPRPEIDIEDFSAPPFFHAPSGQHMEIRREEGRLVFRRWQTDAQGRPIHKLEQDVDWILGSGDHARTYLYRTQGGELYQLPLAWYSQTRSWGMAPGFDRPDHEGVLRRVRRECVFCHASYPDLPAGGDAYSAPQVFPASLPEGIGCQRCHGPAAEHVWLAWGGVGSREEIRASVFNQGRLPPSQRDEVCMACHLQPTVAIPGLRRFGKGDFSFRAGEPLADHFVQVDVEEEGRPVSERFEINHHPYRLRQSRCWTASAGALTCLTCHDPHERVPEERRAEHYRAACLTCHGDLPRTHALGSANSGDCVSCHMPKRRTQDVVRVVMTDHWIRRQPGGPELLAPLSESEPVLTGIRLIDSRAPQGALGEVYRAAAVVRMAATAEAVAHLEKSLAAARPAEIEPWLDLAQGQIRRGRFADAERTLQDILARRPEHPQALEWLALARAGQKDAGGAIEILQKLLALPSAAPRPEAEYNLGRLLTARDPAEGAKHLEKALAARPNLVAAWYHLGRLRAASGRTNEALACWRRALEIDPTHRDSLLALQEAEGSPLGPPASRRPTN